MQVVNKYKISIMFECSDKGIISDIAIIVGISNISRIAENKYLITKEINRESIAIKIENNIVKILTDRSLPCVVDYNNVSNIGGI